MRRAKRRLALSLLVLESGKSATLVVTVRRGVVTKAERLVATLDAIQLDLGQGCGVVSSSLRSASVTMAALRIRHVTSSPGRG